MAKSRTETPAVTTYADYEVIVPSNKLKKAVGRARNDDDPVARAEAALAELSSEFAGWMDEECERLDQARRKLKLAGFTAAAREELFHAAHDIKGEADTFGFPMVGHVAESLCRLIEHAPDLSRVPLALVDQHVDAVRAIIREAERADAEKTASKLAAGLRQVTDGFLAHENRDRPDYLDELFAPPLAPGEH